MFGVMRKRQSREPTESLAVTKNVTIALWSSLDVNGKPSFRWSLSRIDREGNLRKSFNPQHICEMPEVIRVLAQSFSQLNDVDETQRREFERLAVLMEQAIEQLRPNGQAADKPSSSGRILG